MEIVRLESFDAGELKRLNRLLSQLSKSSAPMNSSQLERILLSDCTRIYVAREMGCIIGMLSLVAFSVPTGLRAWVEDVVVDAEARGKGVGRALCVHAMKEAGKFGGCTLDLTSRPSRLEANRLYQSLGFKRRDTNVYRLRFEV